MMRITVAGGLCAGIMAWSVIAAGADPIALRREFRAAVAADPGKTAGYLNSADPEIRRYALYLVFQKEKAGALKELETAMSDADEQVRLTAVAALASLAASNAQAQALLSKAATDDASNAVRQIAVKASWPFHREIKLLRQDPSWDHEVATVKSIALPETGWKFRTDPKQEGHLKNFFAPGFDDSQWQAIKIGHWEGQGAPDYDGVAWYRIRFSMPEKIDSNAVEIAFGAVDEAAWVWLNGEYLGCHDLGLEGWDQPFEVDCRKEIRWGAENVLVVRVLDSGAAGGIWKPVRVDVLK